MKKIYNYILDIEIDPDYLERSLYSEEPDIRAIYVAILYLKKQIELLENQLNELNSKLDQVEKQNAAAENC